MPTTPPDPPAARFARIIAVLLAMVGARLERPGKPGLTAPLTLAIAIRLQRIRNRLARYAARWDAGTLAPPRARRPTPRRRSARGATRWDALPTLPRGRAWLVRLVPGSGVGATQLRDLLDAPEMRAMLAAAPQIGRTLRPVWHMLSAEPLPDALRPSRPVSPDPPPGHPRPPRRLARRRSSHHRPPPASGGRRHPPYPARDAPARCGAAARL